MVKKGTETYNTIKDAAVGKFEELKKKGDDAFDEAEEAFDEMADKVEDAFENHEEDEKEE